MKKTVAWIAFASLISGSAFAGNYGAGGCGLGSVLMGRDGNQILAATTNASTYSQFFGITSGTSNCTDDGATAKGKEVPAFVESNQQALANDIARGSGETLKNLSAVMGCSDPQSLGAKLQRNYGAIYPNPSVSAEQVTDSILNTVWSDTKLVSDCKNAG